MKILIHQSFKDQLEKLKIKNDTYPIYGIIYDNCSICHFISLEHSSSYNKLIGYLIVGSSEIEDMSINKNIIDYPFLKVKIASEDIYDLKIDIFYNIDNLKTQVKADIEIIDLKRLFVRIDQKETPLQVLKEKKVAIIGMGSGGSLLAVYLAKSGIRNLLFIDNDILETHNIIRHISDLNQLGRFKTKAVKDYIQLRIPNISITTIEKKFTINTKTDADYFIDLFNGIDLIVAVSGEHDVNFALNDFIHSNQLQIPIIYAGTFDGVKGGLMFKVDPREEEFCYHCVYSDPENNSLPSTIDLEKKISYDRTLQEQLAQPGLGLDIDNLTILVSKFCLDVLLIGTEHRLYHFSHNFYMWFNRTLMNQDKTSIKFEGLELYYYEDLKKDPRCPFHSSQILEEKEH